MPLHWAAPPTALGAWTRRRKGQPSALGLGRTPPDPSPYSRGPPAEMANGRPNSAAAAAYLLPTLEGG